MVDFASSLWMPSPNFWANRLGHLPLWIILHGTAGGTSAQNIAAGFTPGAQVSSHYVIGQDGVVVQCVEEHHAAWANGVVTDTQNSHPDPWWNTGRNPNLVTISLEHVKPDKDNSTPLSPLQQTMSFRVIADICRRWHIPARKADGSGGITGHFSMDPKNRAGCPGPYPWEELWNSLGELLMIDLTHPVVSQYFAQTSPTSWICKKTGYSIAGSMLDYYRKTGAEGLAGLTDLGLPLEDAHPGTRTGTLEQTFERGVVLADAAHVLESPPGAGNCYKKNLAGFYSLPAQMLSLQQQRDALSATLKQESQEIEQLEGENKSLQDKLTQEATRILPAFTKSSFEEAIASLLSGVEKVQHLEQQLPAE